MKRETVIWGAGNWGIIAYYYYKKNYSVICYVDSNKELWGQRLNDLEVRSPDFLYEKKVTVVIACKSYIEEIKKQLVEDYQITDIVIFNTDIMDAEGKLYDESKEDSELIVSFLGGLGNQMFEYALYKIYKDQGKNVKADYSSYSESKGMPFILKKVFPQIKMDSCLPEKKKIYAALGKLDKSLIYRETKENEFLYNPELLNRSMGCVVGYHQSYRYPEMVKEELLSDFKFNIKNNDEIAQLSEMMMQSGETVSVHFRRGDYLTESGNRIYGNICTDEYYQRAIDFISVKVVNPIFYFFSDDIDWVKKKYNNMNAVFIEKEMFQEYEDWYDMYVMSQCRHNIIANSTFSWWGAWLNQNPGKIVVAPKKWLNNNAGRDICPANWIRI